MKFIQNNFIHRYYTAQNDRVQILLLSSTFSLSLLAFRMMFTGTYLFGFLAWNMFLAWIPLVISGNLSKNNKPGAWKLALMGLTWLLFVPNSFYIITDLFHIRMSDGLPLWYDLALLFSFAWTGLLFGIVSVREMEKLFEKTFDKKFDLLFLLPVMFLNGLGVYVGRYLRYNSWDVITNPFQLIEDIVFLFIHPIHNRIDWSMIICYSLLLMLIYLAFKKLSRSWS